MYVACLLEKERKSQREVAEALEWKTTEPTIRYNYRLLIKILKIEDEVLIKHEMVWREKPVYPKIPEGSGTAKERGKR